VPLDDADDCAAAVRHGSPALAEEPIEWSRMHRMSAKGQNE
jgi:hypothetical protein